MLDEDDTFLAHLHAVLCCRLSIPKGREEMRPIGISACEDKLVQNALLWRIGHIELAGRPWAVLL
jgi:hypothetical protein